MTFESTAMNKLPFSTDNRRVLCWSSSIALAFRNRMERVTALGSGFGHPKYTEYTMIGLPNPDANPDGCR